MPMPPAKGEVEKKLDTFTADYMRVMNAPGMTQALTDTKTTIRTAGYGFANVDSEDSGDRRIIFSRSDRLPNRLRR